VGLGHAAPAGNRFVATGRGCVLPERVPSRGASTGTLTAGIGAVNPHPPYLKRTLVPVLKFGFVDETPSWPSIWRAASAEPSCRRRCKAWARAHARGLTLLGPIQVAILPEQGVLAAPAPRLQRASKHLRAPSSLGASVEASCCRRRKARRPTPAGSRHWGRSTPPLCPSKVYHLRPRRAASDPGGR
jgi:hypothetical protein